MLTRKDPPINNTTTFGYNNANQLKTPRDGGHKTSFIYNGDGIRTAKETSSTYREYVLDHNRSLLVVPLRADKEPMCYNTVGCTYPRFVSVVEATLMIGFQWRTANGRNPRLPERSIIQTTHLTHKSNQKTHIFFSSIKTRN
jgi:hypothetical protein